jgi:hypothetical protein
MRQLVGDGEGERFFSIACAYNTGNSETKCDLTMAATYFERPQLKVKKLVLLST